MLQLLYKYLVLNKKVVIPGIGIFYLQRQPASLDFSSKTFVSPSAHVAFTAADAPPDTRFYSFLSYEKQIEEADALLYFTNFINRIKESLHTKGRVELSGFGVLSTDLAGTLQFNPGSPLQAALYDVPTERTINEVPGEQMAPDDVTKDNQTTALEEKQLELSSQKKDYWWILAIMLAAAAIAAIIYYYSLNRT